MALLLASLAAGNERCPAWTFPWPFGQGGTAQKGKEATPRETPAPPPSILAEDIALAERSLSEPLIAIRRAMEEGEFDQDYGGSLDRITTRIDRANAALNTNGVLFGRIASLRKLADARHAEARAQLPQVYPELQPYYLALMRDIGDLGERLNRLEDAQLGTQVRLEELSEALADVADLCKSTENISGRDMAIAYFHQHVHSLLGRFGPSLGPPPEMTPADSDPRREVAPADASAPPKAGTQPTTPPQAAHANATVRITSAPAPFAIYANGHLIGTSPLWISLKAGSYRFEARSPHWGPIPAQSHSFSGGAAAELHFVAPHGFLSMAGCPTGLTALAKNQSSGVEFSFQTADPIQAQLPPGHYELRLDPNPFAVPVVASFTVANETVTRLAFPTRAPKTSPEATALARIETIPIGMSVLMDGTPIGNAPISTNLPPGEYVFQATIGTFAETEPVRATLAAGRSTPVRLALPWTSYVAGEGAPAGTSVYLHDVRSDAHIFVGRVPFSDTLAPAGTFPVYVILPSGQTIYMQNIAVVRHGYRTRMRFNIRSASINIEYQKLKADRSSSMPRR